MHSDYKTVLSINRFERKKNIELAIESYAKYLDLIKDRTDDTKLFIAGRDYAFVGYQLYVV